MSSVPVSPAVPPPDWFWPPSDSALLQAVNSVPELGGAGVVLLANGTTYRLKATPPGDMTVVFELRPSPIAATPAHPRTPATNPVHEWLSLGFNCGGAVLAWVGVVGTAATAPVTGGQSLWVTGALWGGALATSGACAVSAFRVGAMVTGHDSIDEALDRNKYYRWTMWSFDAVGLLGAGGAIRDVAETQDALDAVGVDWRYAMAGKISRPMRRRLTEELGLVGAKRVAGPMIGAVVKYRLLAGIAAAVGLTGSAATGVIHDLIVWIVYPPQR